MELIAALIGLSIALYFWRFFLPLTVFVALLGGGIALYHGWKDNQQDKEREQKAKRLKEKINIAQNKPDLEGKEWNLRLEADPASGINIVRTASIQSNDGLCYLRVQKRVSGSQLTGLDCPGIKISEYEEIDIKFDTTDVSKVMEITTYTDSDSVYIPSYQYTGVSQLSYEDFINGLKTANYVAIHVPAKYPFWTRFSLNHSENMDAATMIGYLGGPSPFEKQKKRKFDLSTAKPVYPE